MHIASQEKEEEELSSFYDLSASAADEKWRKRSQQPICLGKLFEAKKETQPPNQQQ